MRVRVRSRTTHATDRLQHHAQRTCPVSLRNCVHHLPTTTTVARHGQTPLLSAHPLAPLRRIRGRRIHDRDTNRIHMARCCNMRVSTGVVHSCERHEPCLVCHNIICIARAADGSSLNTEGLAAHHTRLDGKLGTINANTRLNAQDWERARPCDKRCMRNAYNTQHVTKQCKQPAHCRTRAHTTIFTHTHESIRSAFSGGRSQRFRNKSDNTR